MKRSTIYIGVSILAFVALLIMSLPYISGDANVEYVENVLPEVDSTFVQDVEPTMLYGFEVDSLIVIEDKIRRNQNLSHILSKHNVDHQTIYQLDKVSRGVFDVRKIVANRKITLLCYSDSMRTVKAVVYEPSEIEYVVFNLDDSVHVEKVERKIEVIEKTAVGVINASLAVTMDELGLSPLLTNDFADIFAWQIDFFHLYPGDKFRIIYEEESVEGKTVGIKGIVGAHFVHADNDYYAVLYDQGNGLDYFDEEGASLRKAFLPYPVQFTRISSRYSGRRYHPVQKRYKAHRGTDFAAPRGTPIRSVGDGVVQDARFGQFNGNYVKIKHNGNYTTGYLHMSGFAKGIRSGVKVKQGQVIGYVGSSGLAKGNHVCFRFWKNGAQVDYLRVEIPPSEPIIPENMPAYLAKKNEIIARLSSLHFPQNIEPVAMINK